MHYTGVIYNLDEVFHWNGIRFIDKMSSIAS
jgi:hypothetical protein